jgi:hypothetical protein
VLKDRELLLMRLDDGQATDVATFLTGSVGRLRTARSAPGSLWVTVDASPGTIVRLVPVS